MYLLKAENLERRASKSKKRGRALRLINTDGNPALLKVVKEVYPSPEVQRYIIQDMNLFWDVLS